VLVSTYVLRVAPEIDVQLSKLVLVSQRSHRYRTVDTGPLKVADVAVSVLPTCSSPLMEGSAVTTMVNLSDPRAADAPVWGMSVRPLALAVSAKSPRIIVMAAYRVVLMSEPSAASNGSPTPIMGESPIARTVDRDGGSDPRLARLGRP
jgi:hypothetical protein